MGFMARENAALFVAAGKSVRGTEWIAGRVLSPSAIHSLALFFGRQGQNTEYFRSVSGVA